MSSAQVRSRSLARSSLDGVIDGVVLMNDCGAMGMSSASGLLSSKIERFLLPLLSVEVPSATVGVAVRHVACISVKELAPFQAFVDDGLRSWRTMTHGRGLFRAGDADAMPELLDCGCSFSFIEPSSIARQSSSTLSPPCILRRIVEFQRFLMALSVRPWSSLEISTHLFPIVRWAWRRIRSSSSVHCSFLMLGSS